MRADCRDLEVYWRYTNEAYLMINAEKRPTSTGAAGAVRRLRLSRLVLYTYKPTANTPDVCDVTAA